VFWFHLEVYMLVYPLNCLICFHIISRNQELTKANEEKRGIMILKNKQGVKDKLANQNMLQVIHMKWATTNKIAFTNPFVPWLPNLLKEIHLLIFPFEDSMVCFTKCLSTFNVFNPWAMHMHNFIIVAIKT
jgi:hypothetical protein